MKIIHGIAICVATLGSSAALAQTHSPPNPTAAPSVTGAPADAGEPSAATPGTTTDTGDNSGVSRTATQTFITQTAYANQAEIAAARYALAHSPSGDVKRFARRMITDHTRANGELKQIATNQGFAAPSGLSNHDRGALDRLERDRGAKFDAAYAQSQERDHTEVVAMFKRAEQDRRLDPTVRNFAQMTLPALEDHLQMANQLVASHAEGNKAAG